MLHLLAFLVAFASAQLWPLDFGDPSSIAPNDQIWLDPGKSVVDIDPATDYSDAFIEFTFKSVYPSQACEYQVWADGQKVYSGTFRNAVPTMIPSMRGSFPLGTSEISVWTSGCYLNRHAIPYTYGANGDSVYLYDTTPATTAANFPLGGAANTINYGSTAPADATEFNGFLPWFTSEIGQNGGGSFSSQIGELINNNEGWYYNVDSGTQTYLPVGWTDIDPFNASDSQFIIEVRQYSKNDGGAFQFYGCNTSVFECTDNVTEILAGGGVDLQIDFQFKHDSEFDRMYFNGEATRQTEAATLKVSSSYLQWDSTTVSSELGSLLLIGNPIILPWINPPYIKFWNLDSAANSDPNHVVVDLRGLTNPAASAGDCTARTFNPNTTFYSDPTFSSEGAGDYLSGTFYPFFGAESASALNPFGWFQCPNDDSGQLSQPVTCSELSNVAANPGTVVTNPVTVTIDLPGGAIMSIPVFDAGAKAITSGPCSVAPNGYENYYLSQMSWFDVEYDSIVSGTVGQAILVNNFQGRALFGGTEQSFFIDTATTTGAPLLFRSKPGYSIDMWPFAFIHGLRPLTGNATGCDETVCENGGVCTGANAQVCTNPASQGGEPTQNEGADAVVRGAWSGLWYGDLNEIPVPYCTLDTCWNGGVCQENPDRFWNPELYGTGGADDTTLCDCSAVTRETVLNITDGSSTGPYWGSKCQYAPPCDARPCLNGGVCTNGVGPAYTCDCATTSAPYSEKPFIGDRCEIDPTLPCDLNPCLNAGACTDTPGTAGGYTCACAGGWSGHSCGIPPVDNCLLAAAGDTCGEFGRCVASVNPTGIAPGADYTQCVCLYGYTGATCDTPPAACSEDYTDAWQKRDVSQRQFNAAYCLNGGSCIGVGGSSQIVACLCEEPWVGSRCQWNSTVFAGASSFGASLMTVLLLAVVTLF